MPNQSPNILVRCTLAPLVQDARDCLICRDIGGMESVTLERVEFYYPGSLWQRISRQSDDIFALVENGIFRWPAVERISSARFRIRLKNDRRTYQVLIRPPGRSVVGRSEAIPVIEEWLQKRKFMEVLTGESQSLE